MSETLSHYGHAPVLVLPSPPLDALMQKNHLTFTELLKPFGQPPLLSSAMHFTTPNRGRYQLKRWGVRFVAPSEMEPLSSSLSERFLDSVLQSYPIPKPRMADGIRSVEDVSSFVKSTPDPVPWYTRYRGDMLASLRFSEQELLDQPLGVMVAVSSGEGGAAGQWVEMCRGNRVLPNAMQRGVYDAQIVKCVVVVHDKHSEVSDPAARQKAVDMMKGLQRQFGDVMSVVLEINSMPIDLPNASQRDLWSSFVLQGRLMRAYNQRRGEVEGVLAQTKQAGASTAPNAEAAPSMNLGDDSFATFNDDTFHHLPTNIVDFSPITDWTAGDGTPQPTQFQAYLSHLLQTPPEQARGQYLSPFDIDNLTTFTHTFLSQHILPALEQRFVALTTQVNQVRGSFNRLKAGWKSMMGGGGSGAKGWNPQLNTYQLGSMESQARMLGDLSYVVQDWESAEACYGYCLRDYRNDVKQYRNYHHLASANEMMALTLCHLDPNRYHDNIREHLLAARTTFFSINDHRRAARVSILGAEAYRIKSPSVERWKEGIFGVIKAAKKDFTSAGQHRTVRAALQMEYAAYLFLLPPQPTTPLIRKYALSLLLAGRMYRHFGFPVLEVRCDQSSASLYADKTWRHIDDHVYDKLAKELYTLTQYQQSIHFFVQLIGRPRNIDMLTARPINPLIPKPSREVQERFLRDLVYVVQKWYGVVGEGKEVPGLRLPSFVDESVQVVTNNEVTVPNCYAVQAWNYATRHQKMTINTELNNKPLFNPSMTLYKEADRGCVVNERITVSVRVLNPLQIDLEVKNIRLRARHVSGEGVTVSEGYVEVGELEGGEDGRYGEAPFVIGSQDVMLPAGEAVVMGLTLLPLVQGQLIIEGVQWDVLSLHGYQQFALPPRPVPGPSKNGQPAMQPDPSLSIPILGPAPLLNISLSNLPTQCFHGEYVQASLTLTNAGAIGLTKLSVRVSHPGFVLVGLGEGADSSFNHTSLSSSVSTPALSSHRQPTSSSSPYSCYSYDWSDAGRINLSLTLLPSQSITLPLYIRGAVEGQQLLSLLFRYESVEEGRKFRLGYVEREVRVRPLMGVRLFNKPSFAEVKDSLLGVEINDRQVEGGEKEEEVEVKVEDLAVLSKTWVIAAIGEHPDTSIGGRPVSRSVSQQDVKGVGQQRGGSSSSVSEVDSVMSPHSSLVLFCRITNLPSLSLSSPILQAQCPTQHSSITFTSSSSPTPAPTATPILSPYSNLLGMEKALIVEEERQSLVMNPAAIIADTGSPAKLDLILTWSIPSSSPPRFGFYHLPGVSVMKVLPSACPLKVHLSYPATIAIPASTPFPITFPVHVSIRNILEEQPISFLFETLPPEEEFDPVKRQFRTMAQSMLRGRYVWKGVTRARVGGLKGGEEAEVKLWVDVVGEGEYNLNRFRFTVEVGGGKKPRVFFFPLQHLVRVVKEGGDEGQPGKVTVDAVEQDGDGSGGEKRYEELEEVQE